MYSWLCFGFDPGSLWSSATDLKNELGHVRVFSHHHRSAWRTSHWKSLSPEDQSHRSPCSQGAEAGNLGCSLARLHFQQGSQPTWCLPPTLEQPPASGPSLELPGPSSCLCCSLHCRAASGSQKGLELKDILPQKGCSAGKCIKKRRSRVFFSPRMFYSPSLLGLVWYTYSSSCPDSGDTAEQYWSKAVDHSFMKMKLCLL